MYDSIVNGDIFLASCPKVQSRLHVVRGGLSIDMTRPRPNVWWRFWQWLLLGFTWEKI